MKTETQMIKLADLVTVMVIRGYSDEDIKKTIRAINRLRRFKLDFEPYFKLNPKSIRIYLSNSFGDYDMIIVLHPDNGFYGKGKKYNGISLANRKYTASSFKAVKEKGIIPLDSIAIK
ncbi:MAG TPA: hypothetical protein PK122_02265 [Candidatus Paceibacterota bacterium]|nr:hypothetical protein [Candidatus Paceibacterota bacterium]